MYRIIIFGSLLMICVGEALGDTKSVCDCRKLATCVEQEKTRFFSNYRLCIDLICFIKVPKLSVMQCVKDHAFQLDNVALANLHCVLMTTENLCTGNKTRRSVLNELFAKKPVQKRQTGSFGHYKLPSEMHEFEDCMVSCENRFARKFTPAQQQLIYGEIRPGVMDVITTCTERLDCEIDLLSATSALQQCSKSSSFAEIDQRMYNCVSTALA